MKSKIFFVITSALIFLFLNFLFNAVVISKNKIILRQYERSVYFEGNGAKADLNVVKDAYLLRIQHALRKGQSEEVFVNEKKVVPNIYPYTKKEGDTEASFIYLSKNTVNEGGNTIRVVSSVETPPEDTKIYLRNYYKEIPGIGYILFADSLGYRLAAQLLGNWVPFLAAFFIFIGAGLYFASRRRFFNTDFLNSQIYALLPFLFCLVVLWLSLNLNTPYKFLITPNFFLNFGLASFVISAIAILTKTYSRKIKKVNFKTFVADSLEALRELIKTKNFSALFLILFVILIVINPIFLALNLKNSSAFIENAAYYALIIGIAAKFKKLVKL